ncbi:MAG: aldose epimerase [Chthoniobacterales bacterium]
MAVETIQLRHGTASAELAPSVGGRLMRWAVDGRPILHWPENADWTAPAKIRGGNPLLFPLIARTFLDGKIGYWRGADGVIRPAPMHGLVRTAPFEVVDQTTDRLAMRVAWNDAMAEAWPFPFVFDVEYRLTEDSLHVAFTVENTGDETMPYSIGNHFYFEIPAEERGEWFLDGDFRSFARQDAEGKITPVSAPDQGNALSDPAMIDLFHVGPLQEGVVLRHRLDGRAVAFDLEPDATGANPWYAVTTWTESPESEFYCVEPWTALPDAIHNGLGLRRLKPRAKETLRLSLTAQGW